MGEARLEVLVDAHTMRRHTAFVPATTNGTPPIQVTNGDSLERRLKKELEEQGILDPNDTDQDSSPEDDEILAELQRCQAELKAVSHSLNNKCTSGLIGKA